MDKIVNRIVLLRHEKRGEDPSFNSILTPDGKQNLQSLPKRLQTMGFNPTTIYSSPYLRCLETGQPFLKNSQLRLNVENSLAEWFNPKDKHNNYSIPRTLTSQENKLYHVNDEYFSFLKQDFFLENESWNCCQERTHSFLEFLEKKYGNTEDNILIISHLSVLNAICQNVGHQRDSEEWFEMGSLVKLSSLETF